VCKEAAEAARRQKLHNKPKKLASAGKDLTGCPLLQVRLRLSRLRCATPPRPSPLGVPSPLRPCEQTRHSGRPLARAGAGTTGCAKNRLVVVKDFNIVWCF
jgi:hypothetical protein